METKLNIHGLTKQPSFSPRLILILCYQILVRREANLFAENENKETPCDCAEKQHHKELALSLESQMVFSRDPHADDIEAEYAALDRREVHNTTPSKQF